MRARETLNLAARCRLVAGAVVFDLYGVLLDPEVVRREYHRRVAAILQREYGGTVEAWLRAHDVAYREYVATVTRPGFFRDRPYRDALREAEIGHLRTMFREAGKRPPEGDLFALSEALDEIVLTGIHAAYPETARVLGEVRGKCGAAGIEETVLQGETATREGGGRRRACPRLQEPAPLFVHRISAGYDSESGKNRSCNRILDGRTGGRGIELPLWVPI